MVAANTSDDLSLLYRHEVFSPHVGTDFEVLRGSEWVTVRLAEAMTSSGHRAVDGEKFSLIFRGTPEKPLLQGIHEFKHPELGAFEIFITPIMSAHRDQRSYQAVINREAALL